MKLWILRRPDGPPHYDVADGFVVRAESEYDARMFAAAKCGDEGPNVWVKKASCQELPLDGESGILLKDFNAG